MPNEPNLEVMAIQISDNREDTKKILKILEGNGDVGLCTKVALNCQSLKRVWWWLGSVSIAILGLLAVAFKIILDNLKAL